MIPQNTIPVLDHGFVRLDDAMASDLSVVNAARVSFARRKEEMDDSDEGLIRFLMRDRHGTPFEHNAFRFHIRCPIFVAREWFRHRVGSFNEFSMRYAKATDDFYVPEPEDVRTQVGKPGAYSFEPVEPELAERTREELRAVYEHGVRTYVRLVERGVARELARSVLPVGAYTEFYWTVNARSLMNFVSLRAAETAQREIRRYAEAVEQFFAEQMPVTHAAFVANDRSRAVAAGLDLRRCAARAVLGLARHDPAVVSRRLYGALRNPTVSPRRRRSCRTSVAPRPSSASARGGRRRELREAAHGHAHRPVAGLVAFAELRATHARRARRRPLHRQNEVLAEAGVSARSCRAR